MPRPLALPRRSLLFAGGCLVLLLGGAAAAEQAPGPPPLPTLSSYTFTLRHQATGDALALVRPLLSPAGSLEVLADGRTLVVRDDLASLSRVATLLGSFDHPAAPVRLRLRLVWAGPGAGSRGARLGPALDAELAGRMRRLLRFDTFTLLSEARLEAREGDEVAYEFRTGYRVQFRLGTLLPGQRLKLHGFRVLRSGGGNAPARELVHTTVNLPLLQPLILGLTRDEGSGEALLVVLSYEPPEEG